MEFKAQRGTGKYRSNESKLSENTGTPLKSCQTKRKFTSAVAVVLGTGFREELLHYWITSKNTSFKNKERVTELQILRLRGRRTESNFNENR